MDTNKETGAFSLHLRNNWKEDVLVNASFSVGENLGILGAHNSTHVQFKKTIKAKGDNWGWPQFIRKDNLDKKMEALLDQNGNLNIHLKLSGKKMMKGNAYRACV